MTDITFATKDPSEIELYDMDFSDRLKAGETISTQVCSILVVSGAIDPGVATMLVGAATLIGAAVRQKIQAGLTLNTYLVLYTITTSLGETLVKSAHLPVLAKL